MNKLERHLDQLKIIKSLDISPTMYKDAVEKYQNLATFLQENGINANFYPQGSFALGTVIRPYNKDKERNYDLDFICEIEGDKSYVKPKALRDSIESLLLNSKYKDKLEIFDECFKITYADKNEIGFSIDIVPAINEDSEVKANLLANAEYPELIDSSIAIPRFSNQKIYNWITNNPAGYKKWFEQINEKFNKYSYEEYRKELLSESNGFFGSIDEIPYQLDRSSLQRVIQILKYHRDIFYSHIPNGEDLKPISALISTVVVKISQNFDPRIGCFDLLDIVINEMLNYEEILKIGFSKFNATYEERKELIDEELKWKVENPANPGDNLADLWNKNEQIPYLFFKWLNTAKRELINSVYLPDDEFRALNENAFGQKVVERIWGNKYMKKVPLSLSSTGKSKPWRK